MLLRFLPLIALLATTSLAKAQAPSFLFFEAEQAVERGQLKFLIEAVKNADASADVFHSDDMTILQIRHNGGLSEEGYRTAIQNAGIALRPGTRTPEQLGMNVVDANRPPVYVATGNETADQARYRADVEQWNAAHPDQVLSTTPVHAR